MFHGHHGGEETLTPPVACPEMSTPAPPTPASQHLPWLPAAGFVLVWSSGYIAGPAAVHAAAPFNVLGWRFVLAAVLGCLLALALRRPFRMTRHTLGRVAGSGW